MAKLTHEHNRHPRRPTEQLLSLARELGTLRASDATAHGIPAAYLQRLVARGLLVRVARGTYRLAEDRIEGPHHGLVLVALRSPRAVVALLSALAFYGLSSQLPADVWITISVNTHAPNLTWPSLQVTRASGPALAEGIERHVIEGVVVQIYSPAKTVADCFKYRNRVGLDVALEALKAFRKTHRGRMDELEHYARICRVSRVMRPYLEALSS